MISKIYWFSSDYSGPLDIFLFVIVLANSILNIIFYMCTPLGNSEKHNHYMWLTGWGGKDTNFIPVDFKIYRVCSKAGNRS